MDRYEDPYTKTMREVAGLVQFLIYRYETCAIEDRAEILTGIEGRVAGVVKSVANGNVRWRKGLLELAAYCIFAATSKD